MKLAKKAVSIFIATLIAVTQFSFLTFADSESELSIVSDRMGASSAVTDLQDSEDQEIEEAEEALTVDSAEEKDDLQESTQTKEDGSSTLLEEKQPQQEDETGKLVDSAIRESERQDAEVSVTSQEIGQEKVTDDTQIDSEPLQEVEMQRSAALADGAADLYLNNTLPSLEVDIDSLGESIDNRDINIYGNVILVQGSTSYKYGVIKTDGSIISGFSYDSYEFAKYNEYSTYTIDNKYKNYFYTFGVPYYQLILLKKDGLLYPLNTITGELCDQGFSAVDYIVDGLAIVEKDDKYGVINEAGKVVLAPGYTQIEISSGMIMAVDESSSYYFNEEGKNITPDGFVTSFALSDGTTFNGFFDGLGPVMSTTTHKVGFIDKSGNFVIEPNYDFAGYEIAGPQKIGFINGYTLVANDTQIAYVDTMGTVYDFNPAFREIVETYNGGTFIAQDLDKSVSNNYFSWPVNDQVLVEYGDHNFYLCEIKTGKVTPVPPVTERMYQEPYQSKDVIIVMTAEGPNFLMPDGQLQILDGRLKGCNIQPVTFSDLRLNDPLSATSLSKLASDINGLYHVVDSATTKQGLYNAITGKYLPCEYSDIQLCANGIILTKDGMKGFYDYNLEEILPCVYDNIRNFTYLGAQNQSSNDYWQFLQTEKNGTFTLFTSEGQEKISSQTSWSWMDYDRFSSGNVIYDLNGEKIIEENVDAEGVADAFCNGVLLAWQGEKYGAFDIDGNLIVPMEYDELSHFNAGYAVGKKKGDFSTSVPEVFDIINSKGEVIYSESTMYPSSYAMEVSSQYAVYCGLRDFKIITLPEAETAPEGSIALDQTQLSLYVGNVKTLVASTDPLSASIDWSSENPNIAKVDNNGQVTAVSEGTTTITASITVNQKHYEASCVITVKAHIKFTDKEIQLTIKSSKKLNVKVDPADMSVTWKSNAPDVVSVDNNGVVIGISQGSATITATVLVNGTLYSDSCTVTVGPYIDLSPYFREQITEKDGKKYYEDFSLGEKVFDNWPQNSSQDEKHTLLASFLKNESVTAEIEEKLYNLLFNAQYRPNVFGGNNSDYPYQNYGISSTKLDDNGLGKTIKFTNRSAGCMHYANVAMVYVYGKPSGNTIQGDIQKQVDDLEGRKEVGTAENVKKYLERAVPGSHIRFNYKKSNGSKGVHSIVFLGRDDSNKGFYYISFMGGGGYGTIMSVGYTTYETIAASATYLDVRTVTNSPNEDYKNHIKTIRGTAHCPIDISISYGNETLNSSTNQLSASFGAMTIQEIEGERSVSFEIDYGHEYDIVINGTGTGEMDLTVEFLDENENTFGRVREFYAVPITAQTKGWLSKMDVELPTELILYEGEQFKEVWAACDQDIVDRPNEYHTNLYQSQLPPETQEPEKPNGSQNQNPPSTDNTGSVDNVTGVGNAVTGNNEESANSSNSSDSSNKSDETNNGKSATSDKEETQGNQDTAASSGAESAVTENDQLVPSQGNKPEAASTESGNGLIWLLGAIFVIGILAAVIITVVRRKNESDE